MQQGTPHNSGDQVSITLDDVRRVLAIGKLLASALTPAERQALAAGNDGKPAKGNQLGTRSASTYRHRHVSASKPS